MSIRNLDKLFQPATRRADRRDATGRARSARCVAAQPASCRFRTANCCWSTRIVRRSTACRSIRTSRACRAPPDLAIIVDAARYGAGLVAELGERGTKAAVVITAGFGELGERGRRAAAGRCSTRRGRICCASSGPTASGIMVPGIGLDASFAHLAPPAGDIAFVSQSGAMVTAMLDWAAPRGIGFSHVVSLGDMADVDFGDMLDYLAADPRTRAILLYVEGITHGRKFMSAARAAARAQAGDRAEGRAVDAGARAAASHTGALAGSDAVYDAAFRRAGMLRVDTMAELFDAAETLALTQRAGRRAAGHPDQWRRRRRPRDRRARCGQGGRLAELSRRDDRQARRRAAADLEPRQPGRHHRRRARAALCRRARRRCSPTTRRRRGAGAQLPDGAGGARGGGAGGDRRGCRCPRDACAAATSSPPGSASTRRRPARALFSAGADCRPTTRPRTAVTGFMHRVALSAQPGRC